MGNLVKGEESKDFYVWVNPKDLYVHHNANQLGTFVSVANQDDNLMFLPNENFSGYISPFQGNLLRSYLAEYNLEAHRKEKFPDYPSRLVSTFLFESNEEAERYRETHGFHVGERLLKKGHTVGPYTYSSHDLSWIDFLRSNLVMDQETIAYILQAYWQGKSSEDFKLEIVMKTITAVAVPNFEILFLGRIDFER